jgi:hypothetical protein
MQIAFLSHQAGSFLEYLDGNQIVSLDSFISFSANPEVAINFANQSFSSAGAKSKEPEPPRLLVISVGPSDFATKCEESPMQVGIILNPKNCGKYKAFNEMEYPAFYQVNNELLLGNFIISPQVLFNHAGAVMGCDNPAEYDWQCMCRRFPETCPTGK